MVHELFQARIIRPTRMPSRCSARVVTHNVTSVPVSFSFLYGTPRVPTAGILSGLGLPLFLSELSVNTTRRRVSSARF